MGETDEFGTQLQDMGQRQIANVDIFLPRRREPEVRSAVRSAASGHNSRATFKTELQFNLKWWRQIRRDGQVLQRRFFAGSWTKLQKTGYVCL